MLCFRSSDHVPRVAGPHIYLYRHSCTPRSPSLLWSLGIGENCSHWGILGSPALLLGASASSRNAG